MRQLAIPGVWYALGLCVTQTAGCTTSSDLERVAKDWCMTIRASQILPVYPLTEDLQPGDVFAVQTPLSKQADIYKKRGFLPLDQLVTRLHDLPYKEFYKDAYWKGTYSELPHERPLATAGDLDGADTTDAPRATFPSYNFSVQQGGGIKLAIPIDGVPVGLGLMGASRATGSVTIKDAYTYGIQIEAAVVALLEWWRKNNDVRIMMGEVAKQSSEAVYLRVVNRVYLARGVTVHLTNLDAISSGGDVGVARAIQPPDLSQADPTKLEASARAYGAALASLSSSLSSSLPGGSLRVAQASQRSVTMNQTFDRPLVVGYLGFDVKVYEDGTLSPPIPSYAVLNQQLPDTTGEGRLRSPAGDTAPPAGATSKPVVRGVAVGSATPPTARDDLLQRYEKWLKQPGNRSRIDEKVKPKGLTPEALTEAEHRSLLRQLDQEFRFGLAE